VHFSLRQRDRNRDQLLNQIIRQNQERRLNNAQVPEVIDMAGRDDHRGLHRAGELNASRNNATYSNSGPSNGNNKRKSLYYGPESVESWAATEVQIFHYS